MDAMLHVTIMNADVSREKRRAGTIDRRADHRRKLGNNSVTPVLPSFTAFYRVSCVGLSLNLVSLGRTFVVPSFTGFYRVLRFFVCSLLVAP